MSTGTGDAKGFAETCGAPASDDSLPKMCETDGSIFESATSISPILAKFSRNSTEGISCREKSSMCRTAERSRRRFAVVEVEGLKQPVVVPMNRIRGSVCE